MISKILIKNFQSHRETTLELHEGVNALVGLTAAGKSVVFKALDWVARNRPLGTEFMSWWGGDTQVEIVLKEGQKIGRIRTDTQNYYYIDKKKFEAFGKGPAPQPVSDLLNLSDVNFQAQTDPSFLISNSSGEVARYLNKAAHLDIIDQALSSITSTLRDEKGDLGQAKKDLEQAQEHLVLYNWLPEAEEKLVGLEKLQEKIAALVVQSSALVIVVEEYKKTEEELVGLKEILKLGVEVERLTLLNQGIENQNTCWEQLAAVIDQYEKVEKELASLIPLEGMGSEVKRLLILEEGIKEKRQKYYAFFDLTCDYEKSKKESINYNWLPKAEQEWKQLDSLTKKHEELRNNRFKLYGIAHEIDGVIVSLDVFEKSQKALETEFKRLAPNTCPLCNQRWIKECDSKE